GLALLPDGSSAAPRVEGLRPALGTAPHHLRIATSRRSDLQGAEGELPHGVVTLSWGRLSRRMAKADQGHAALWETIGEIGETSGRPVVQFPVEAKELLRKRRGAEAGRARRDVRRQGGRT